MVRGHVQLCCVLILTRMRNAPAKLDRKSLASTTCNAWLRPCAARPRLLCKCLIINGVLISEARGGFCVPSEEGTRMNADERRCRPWWWRRMADSCRIRVHRRASVVHCPAAKERTERTLFNQHNMPSAITTFRRMLNTKKPDANVKCHKPASCLRAFVVSRPQIANRTSYVVNPSSFPATPRRATLWTCGREHAQADRTRRISRSLTKPLCGAAVISIRAMGAAADHAPCASLRPRRISRIAGVGSLPIKAPLPHVPVHVVQTPRIRQIAPY